VKDLIDKFERTGSVLDDNEARIGRPLIRTQEKVEETREKFEENRRLSLSQASQQLQICETTVRNILHKDLKMKAYKFQVFHKIPDYSFGMRFDFANIIIDKVDKNEIESEFMFFSDEAHVHLDGTVNKQNWRIWGTENPHIGSQKPLHSKRITIWAAVSKQSVIGPIFIEENVNSHNYVELLENKFIPAVQRLGNLNRSWFMQDGARPHRTPEIFDLLEKHFQERVIAFEYPKFKGKGFDWPTYSPDLNPCDFWLWGMIKDRIYVNQPTTIDQVKLAIQSEFEKICSEMLTNVHDGFIKRLRHTIATEGKHFENLI
jgi:hypothetical protein